MIGIVEIYKDDELICSEENLIVDGASELITNILTISPSLSGTGFSSIGMLDTSNYTIHAVSFAKDPSAYLYNAHNYNDPNIVSGYNTFSPARIILSSINNTSSYTPSGLRLPQYPNSLDQVLQLMPSSVSSLIRDYGHNLNLIPYWSSVSSVSSIGLSGAYLLGCYPRGGVAVAQRDRVFLYDTSGNFKASSTFNSAAFNGATFQPMNWKGFLMKGRNNPLQGVVTSADAISVSSYGEVAYQIRIGADDLALANLYGGITVMGLWSLNLFETLKKNYLPPYANNPITDERVYKLFAKKVFSKNLCAIQDSGTSAGISPSSYSILNIVWRIKFV